MESTKRGEELKISSPSRHDVISELELLVRQYAILTFDPSSPIEIPSEELEKRAGTFIYNLENISLAEYRAMLAMETKLREGLLKAKDAVVVVETERKKLPAELISKINLYADRGRSVLDLSGKRFVVTSKAVNRDEFKPIRFFLKEKNVPEEHIRALLPRAFRDIKNHEQSPERILQNFLRVKGKLSSEDLATFYRIYEDCIEPFDREVQRHSVQCLESIIRAQGEKDSVCALIEQPPFRLNYIQGKQKIPARWNSVAVYAREDTNKTPVRISCIEFRGNYATWFMKSAAGLDYAQAEKKNVKDIRLRLNGEKGIIRQIGNKVFLVTAPEDYSPKTIEKALLMAAKCIDKSPLKMDYIPYHISIPEGFMPIQKPIITKRVEAGKRLVETFGNALIEILNQEFSPEADEAEHPDRLPHYKGIHTTFIYPLPGDESRTGIAEVQTFTWLGFIDQSEAGRAPHRVYKKKKYEAKVAELFPAETSEATSKRNEYYVKAVVRQISAFEREILSQPNLGNYPAERFTELFYSYVEHIIDRDASVDLKFKLQETLLPKLLKVPEAYKKGATFDENSFKAMVNAVDFGIRLLPEFQTKETRDQVLKRYSSAIPEGQTK
ncbi:MAG: hypothetical protein V1702_04445 [Candidatus Woesearchaeota archaeon]